MRFINYLLFVGLVVSITQNVVAQKGPVFFEVINNDSVALFFNEANTFTEKECYDFTRFIRVTESGDFNGYFEDRRIDQSLRAFGTYANGLKHGYFELYYSNGNTMCKGYYENNIPVGIWEYFYDTGIPERTLKITDTTVLLMRFVDKNGIVTVNDGNGRFDSTIPRLYDFYNVRVVGNVVDGQPDGKWIAVHPIQKTSLYTERFDHGRLIKTSLISKRKITPTTPSTLSNFFTANYLRFLEGFYFQECSESDLYSNKPWLSSQILRAELTRKIDLLIEGDFRKHKIEHYNFGDNFLVVQFSVNKKGKAEEIQLVSEWGSHFFETIKNSIGRATFSTKNETMYFRMKLSYAGGRKYRYSFKISKK